MMNEVIKENENEAQTQSEQRDYRFDNLKAILIFLVVLGHLVEVKGVSYKENLFRTIWIAIYSFHMPLFMFITGYFTKYDINNAKKAVKNYLIPYMIFNTILYLVEVYVLKNEKNFGLMYPGFSMWFLLSVFYYKIIYNGIYKIRGLLAISIITSVLIGLDSSFDLTASLSRTVCLLPFFVAGSMFNKKYLIKDIKSQKMKYILVILLAIIILLYGYIASSLKIPIETFGFSLPYRSYETVSTLTAMTFRILVILFAFVFGYLILNLVPNHKTKLSNIGQNTIITYILQAFLIRILGKLNIVVEPTINVLITYIIFATIFVYITSRPFLKRWYDNMMNKIYEIIGI